MPAPSRHAYERDVPRKKSAEARRNAPVSADSIRWTDTWILTAAYPRTAHVKVSESIRVSMRLPATNRSGFEKLHQQIVDIRHRVDGFGVIPAEPGLRAEQPRGVRWSSPK